MSAARIGFLLALLIQVAVVAAGEPEFANVFVPNADGFKSIRIPAVVASKSGMLLAFAEGRAANADQASNKIVQKRSSDGGKTWGRLAILADDGLNSLNNPCVVVERGTGRLLLMYQSYPAGLTERSRDLHGGYVGNQVVRAWLITSDDDGATWSRPREITTQVKRPSATTVTSGPGIGIQLRHGKHAGRILFPFNDGPFGLWNIYAAYSDDGGKTWAMGEDAPGNLIDDGKGGKISTVNEAQFVELGDGSIRFNVRRWGGKPLRKTCVSADGGATWSKIQDVPEQADPSCMGSIFQYTDPADGSRSRILYSGPQSTRRENGAVFLSYDAGKTWPVKRVLSSGGFAYSCLTALPDGVIGCLYEAQGTGKILFARFTLDWLTSGKDHLEKRPK
jgi:sialidase-1